LVRRRPERELRVRVPPPAPGPDRSVRPFTVSGEPALTLRRGPAIIVLAARAVADAEGFPSWPKGADCKSAGVAFGGSNPPPSTKQATVRATATRGGATVARRAHNPEVAGSNPAPATNRSATPAPARIAQSVERLHGKEEVPSSNLGAGSSIHRGFGDRGGAGNAPFHAPFHANP